MATPIGHSLAGYAIYSLATPDPERRRLGLLLLCLFMANAPDLDFLPGIIMGTPALYHQGITHSLGCALLLSLTVAGIGYLGSQSFGTFFSLSCIAYLSHLVIDFLSVDRRPPYGIPLLWPVSGAYFISSIPMFLGVRHSAFTLASTTEWVKGILRPYNLSAIGLEVVLMLPFIIFGSWRHRASLSQQRLITREGR